MNGGSVLDNPVSMAMGCGSVGRLVGSFRPIFTRRRSQEPFHSALQVALAPATLVGIRLALGFPQCIGSGLLERLADFTCVAVEEIRTLHHQNVGDPARRIYPR